ncbi:hypothetical protein HY638_00645 [Candidatus Woesearchaeota archaeon]|nr:hypothetical protein [Candidatus Woesearchaeota archaeon]
MKSITRFSIGFFLVLVVILSSCSIYQKTEKPRDPGVTYVPLEEIKVEEGKAVNESKKDAIVIIVNETQLVRIEPEAFDPDNDKLAFSYSFPLDQNGRWQTTYGDEGEYTVTLTASDGQFSVSKDILIIVNKKEEPPQIDSFAPAEKAVKVNEDSSVLFAVNASDLNKDKLSFEWKLDGKTSSDRDSFLYKTTFDDSGSHTIKVIVSDGVLEADSLWSVTVDNVNRLPVIQKINDIKVKETETVNINVLASDPDKDALSITIGDPVGDDGTWKTTYDDSGVYTVKVTASDGVDTVSQDVKVTVENVNRAPVIVGVSQG